MKFKFAFTFRYAPELSENNRLGFNPRSGRMYAKNEYKETQMLLALVAAKAARDYKVEFSKNKRIRIKLLVCRPNAKADASNFIKAINDAISKAIGINDTFFDGEYSGLIDYGNPRFEIMVWQ